MKKSFIFTLPSNVPGKDNTLARYVTKLPSTLALGKSWRVALVEISYTKSWFNIHKDHVIQVVDDEGGVFDCPQKLLAGRYETEQDLIDSIHACVKSLDIGQIMRRRQTHAGMLLRENHGKDKAPYEIVKEPMISLNTHNRRASVLAGERKDGAALYLSFDEELETMLGISRDHFHYEMDFSEDSNIVAVSKSINGVAGSFRSYDLLAGVHSLLVYCNLVKPVLVGNTYANLLRRVHVPHKTPFGNQVNIQFNQPYYLPLASSEFDQIEFEIRDDNNNLIPFQWGRTTITLEFSSDG